ncbi:hypothetical protein ABD76_28015 [Paenibacillus dendritiformis]|uniref:hypothetical protein n=1 Tax=Paenibacillus dendritiformis TaxID=130049 RepID=UPI0018CF3BBA|nr:hypothetical protein [Paenibacillus dendritiformis]MBG9796069.1 hypothetical protein [Paenibacillus dendritiformis]
MTRFIWLLLTLSGWVFLYWRLPNGPLLWVWVPSVISLFIYMYGWTLERENKLIYFFACLLWAGIGLSLKAKEAVATESSFPISISGTAHAVFIVSLIISTFLTFANYRAEHNLKNRRGNVSKQQLVHVKPTAADRWNSFKGLFVRTKTEIVLNLGEEIPMKD